MISFSLQKLLHTAEGEMQLNVAARFESGQFVSLYGASGAGKTSILRMLAGLLKPDAGAITINNTHWFNGARNLNTAPQQRSIGFVFQDYALFPNMNVRENIAFALAKHESHAIVDELLEVTELTRLANRKIQTLSGGQQQRVALARAIAKKPSILLLDEPLSAIDNELREQLQGTLLQLHKRYALTTILVSHNVNEIIRLSDLVIHLEQGRFVQQATPAQLFHNGHGPSTLSGRIVATDPGGNAVVLIENRLLSIPVHGTSFQLNDSVEITYGNTEVKVVQSPAQKDNSV